MNYMIHWHLALNMEAIMKSLTDWLLNGSELQTHMMNEASNKLMQQGPHNGQIHFLSSSVPSFESKKSIYPLCDT